MVINFFISSCPKKPTGGAKVIYEYSNYLVEQGHSVHITFDGRDILKRKFIPEFIRKPVVLFVCIFFRPSWFELNNLIKKHVLFEVKNDNFENADAVIATDVMSAPVVKGLSSSKGKKFYFIQGFESWERPEKEVFETYNCGMTNIVVAKWLKEIVDAHSLEPSHLVSNGINTEVFKCNGFERRKHSLVFHYRSAELKGCSYAIEVVKKLLEKYPDLHVDVISVEDKPDCLPACCEFHHALCAKEIAEINNKVQVFICTSIEEGFGLPGLEAMACGCALVSTSFNGVLEYAVDGENVLLSPVKDVDNMVKNVVKLFEDESLINRISENGKKTGMKRSLRNSAFQFERVLLSEVKDN